MALIIIVAGPNSDSYISLVEANEYIANRPDATNWNNSDYKERERLLRQATIDIDILRFKGNRMFNGGLGSRSVLGLFPVPTLSILDLFEDGIQRLQFPRDWHEYYTGHPDSGSTTTLVDTNFTLLPREDDYFKYGAIYVLDGTNEGEFREISAYSKSTGTFTVSTAFSSALDSTSYYLILSPIDRYVKYAVVEQGLYLSNNLETKTYLQWRDAGISARSIGDVSIKFSGGAKSSIDRIGGFLSSEAFRYIRKYVDKNAGTGRA